jgi:hypothetical protein
MLELRGKERFFAALTLVVSLWKEVYLGMVAERIASG